MTARFPQIAAALVAGVAGALLLACATPPPAKDDTPPPQVVSQDLDITQDITSVTLAFSGAVQAEAPATLEKASWEVVVDGEVVKSGDEQLGLQLAPGQSVPFAFTVSSSYVSSAEELKAMNDRGGSLLAAVRGKLHVKQGGQAHLLDFARGREVRTPRLPSVKIQELDAARYSAEEANMLVSLGLVNPNPFQLRVGGMEYAVLIAGKQVGEGTRAVSDLVTPASTGVYEISVPISEATVGPEVKALIKSQNIPWNIRGQLKGELYTVPFDLQGTVRLNVSN